MKTLTTQRISHPQHSQVAELVKPLLEWVRIPKMSERNHTIGSVMEALTGSSPVLTTCVVPLRKECQESRFCNLPLQHRGLLILNIVRWRNW